MCDNFRANEDLDLRPVKHRSFVKNNNNQKKPARNGRKTDFCWLQISGNSLY